MMAEHASDCVPLDEQGKLALRLQKQASEDAARAEKMAAYRKHSHELGGLAGGAAIGYLGTVSKSLEAQNRERALQIAWDLYRDKGDHQLVLRAAQQIAEFLSGMADAA